MMPSGVKGALGKAMDGIGMQKKQASGRAPIYINKRHKETQDI